jgi:hypothetical protein
MNFVTENRTRQNRGRPRKHSNAAARTAAWRARKAAATPILPGTRVNHKHGEGIVLVLLPGERAYVAFPERVWRDIPICELTPTGIIKKIPTWADSDIRNTKKRTVQTGGFPAEHKSFYFGRMTGEILVRKYRRTKNGNATHEKLQQAYRCKPCFDDGEGEEMTHDWQIVIRPTESGLRYTLTAGFRRFDSEVVWECAGSDRPGQPEGCSAAQTPRAIVANSASGIGTIFKTTWTLARNAPALEIGGQQTNETKENRHGEP